ncbi:TPA: hypothetical protein I9Y37_001827 [Citrobacter freundii]|nr:hypothetical protein [Citrobacter freundii]HAT3963805.1 hypothetical protein [Citrobacter freundii]
MSMANERGNDWASLATEKFGLVMTPTLLDIIQAVQKPGAMVSAIETIGMGRNVLYALICASAYLFNPELKIVIVTNDSKRLDRAKGEIHSLLITMFMRQGLHHSAITPMVNTCVKGIRQKIEFRTYEEGNEEALAGRYDKHSLYIVDNAALVDDKVFQILSAGMTEEDNRLLLVSEAYRNEGYFYDSHHQLQDMFHTVRSNAKESPFVAPAWFDVVAPTFTPEEYRRRVLGEFPEE